MEKSIIISGVGGQGTLLASRIIGNVAIQADYDVKVSEVHGMSQRGGSVVTYVKYSDGAVYSPVITDGTADAALAFELLEAYRILPSLKKDGRLIANTQRISPMPVIMGAAEYPREIIGKISSSGLSATFVDALKLAQKAGNQKAINVVLLGVYAAGTDIPKKLWLDTITAVVPQKFLQININAFEAGYAHTNN